MRFFCALTALSIILISCTNYELSRRHSRIIDAERTTEATASINVDSFPIPNRAPLTVLGLSERAQAAFVEALAEKSVSASELRSELAQAIRGRNGPNLAQHRARRRLVISVFQENGFEPGDRVSEVSLNITMDDRTQKFLSWDRFAAQSELVELGSIRRTDSTERSLDAGVTSALPNFPISPTLEGSISNTEGVTEEQTLRRRRLVLAGRLAQDGETLSILMEGVTGIDLTGNATVEVDLRTGEVGSLNVVRFTNGAVKDLAGKVTFVPALSDATLRYAKKACPVVATITGEYTVRKIAKSGAFFGGEARTNQEGDDTIALQRHTIGPDRVTLGSAVKSRRFQIGDLRDDSVSFNIESGRGAAAEPIYFASSENAEEFRRWAIAELVAKGYAQLFDGRRVTRNGAGGGPREAAKVDAPNIVVKSESLSNDC